MIINQPLVSASWLSENKDQPDLIILDSSPTSNVSGLNSQYPDKYIPGARPFDLKNDFCDLQHPMPNMLPSPSQFEEKARQLGINNESKIVIYDNLGIYTSPRVWWMFKTMGHHHVAVLNGGLPAWIESGFKTEDHLQKNINPGNFKAEFKREWVRDHENVLNNIITKNEIIIDARSSGRFDGTAPEPRADLSSGHIPGSVNLPFQQVLENGKYKSPEKLKSLFDQINPGNAPATFSCGSGLTACIILLAYTLINNNQSSVYDGSWTEWAQLEDYPIEKI